MQLFKWHFSWRVRFLVRARAFWERVSRFATMNFPSFLHDSTRIFTFFCFFAQYCSGFYFIVLKGAHRVCPDPLYSFHLDCSQMSKHLLNIRAVLPVQQIIFEYSRRDIYPELMPCAVSSRWWLHVVLRSWSYKSYFYSLMLAWTVCATSLSSMNAVRSNHVAARVRATLTMHGQAWICANTA